MLVKVFVHACESECVLVLNPLMHACESECVLVLNPLMHVCESECVLVQVHWSCMECTL